VKKAKDTLVSAIFGLAIIFFSYALSNFVINALTKSAAGQQFYAISASICVLVSALICVLSALICDSLKCS